MDYKLSDLIDVEKSRNLLESFCEAVGIASAIIDLEGNVLIGVRWQKICTNFHRVNEFTCKRCIESDTELANKLSMGKKFSLYRCKNGMTDAASPIIIEGRHIANAFVGQFLLHPPDIEDFRRQAAKFGFNEQDYLNALDEVAIISEKKVAPIMDFLTSYAETLATMGLDKIRRKQHQKELLNHRENLEEMVKERTAELKKLSEAVEQSPVTVMITDKNGTIEYVNPSFSEVTGYSAKEAIGQNPRIVKSGNHPSSFYKELWDTILSGKTWRGEILNRKKSAEEFWESTSISAIKNDAGDITHFVAVKQDITEQKRAGQAIRESEERLSSILKTTNQGFWLVDNDTNTLEVNDAMCKILDRTKEEIIGRTIYDFMDEQNIEKIRGQERTRSERKSSLYEVSLMRSDGKQVPCLVNASPLFDGGGNKIGSFGMFTDITERRHIEEDLKRNVEELELFNKLAIGREIKMIQLKQEINELLGQLGQAEKYEIVE
jgi:two-component system sensor histidine kinase/response regulator